MKNNLWISVDKIDYLSEIIPLFMKIALSFEFIHTFPHFKKNLFVCFYQTLNTFPHINSVYYSYSSYKD